MTHSPYVDEVMIEDHGGGNGARVSVWGVRASQELSNVGSFSCFVLLDDLRRAGFGYTLKDRWLRCDIGGFGRWGGVITARPVTESTIAEIAAEGWASLLGGHMLVDYQRVPSGPAGGLARRVLIDAGTSQPTYLSLGRIDEGGEPLLMRLGGQDALRDVLMALADDIEWIVDEDRVVHVMRRIGKDVSAWVRLVEGRHIAGRPDIADDTWADPADEIFDFENVEETARRRFLSSWGSISAFDPHIGVAQVRPPGWQEGKRRRRQARRKRALSVARRRKSSRGGGATASNMSPSLAGWAIQPVGIGLNNPAVPGDVRTPLPTTPLSISVVNVDNVWAACQIGNVVRVDLLAGFTGRFRIAKRAINTTEGILYLSGEALFDG